MIRQLKYPKQYLLSRDRLTTKSIPLNKHQFNFIHQQFRGQEIKARNKLNFKTGPLTQLRNNLNEIGQANKNSQQRIAHKRNLKKGTRID